MADTQLTNQEQSLLNGDQIPSQSAITNNYDRGPVFSNTKESSAADLSKYGESIRGAIQTQSDAAGGTVTIGTPTVTLIPTANPDAALTYKGPIENPLALFASYTYGLSLHMLTKDDYNKIVEKQNYNPNRVIIASAGRYNNTDGPDKFVRAPYFDIDFYFENLNMRTVIGLNEHSRATNAVDISFNIIEPYGITLFNRIIKLTNEINPESDNYLDQPYLLQIDFFGIDDTGEITGIIPEQTKRIPIRMLKFDIKVSNKGAEYSIQACPYNHSAFDVSSVSTPAHFEVVAGAVATFFQSTETELSATKASIKQQRESEQNQPFRNNTSTYNGLRGGVIGPDGQITYVNTALLSQATLAAAASLATGDPIYRVKSYGSALNAWQHDLESSNKVQAGDRYYFQFPTVTLASGKTISVGDGNFNLSGKLGAKDTPMVDVSNTAAHRKGTVLGIEILALDYKTKIFSINIGTSIEQVINYVVRNSTYILDQMVVPEEVSGNPQAYVDKRDEYKDKPLLWYKVIPSIKLGKFDKIRKQWAREITYSVVPYEVYNTKSSVAPQGKWKDPLKVYNYIYTGENVDVIDFQIEFNALYYTAVTAYRGYLSATTGMPLDEEQKVDNPETYDGIANAPNAVMPMKEKPQTFDARARATGGADTPTSAAAVDTEQTLYTTAGADMLQATIKIIGDPMYIKQDDIFYSPESDAFSIFSGDPRLIANGSLRMDNREVYIQINYKSPSDIDESTGMMKFDSTFLQSLFSGMYKVMTVDSTFSGGQFIQTLLTYRLPRQESLNNESKTAGTTNERNADAAKTPGATLTPPIAPNTTTASLASTGDNIAPNSAPVQDAEPPTTTVDQAKLAEVNNTAPTQPISSNTRPPQLGNDATDAALAENYRQKAEYMRNLAKKYPDDPEYLANAKQYDEWAAHRQAIANGTAT